jgi:hypothetical protein
MLLGTVVLCSALLVGGVEEGFVSLFDGKSLEGWQLAKKAGPGYVVEEGVLVCPATGGGNLFTRDEYANFVFRFEFKLTAGGNNGVGIRAPLEGDAAYVGMEIQLLDDDALIYKALRPEQYCGSVYDVFAAKRGALKKPGKWNTMEIRCEGTTIKVTLNDQVITEGDTSTVTDAQTLEKHPGLKRTTGRIGFLGHGSRLEFKNIRVKKLP